MKVLFSILLVLTLSICVLAQNANVAEARLYCSDAGSTDAYACSLSPSIPNYATGAHYRFKANTANTGAATIAFNGLAAKTIKKVVGGITTDLSDNDIRVGQWVDVVYDGTNMQMQSLLGNAATGSGTVNSGTAGRLAAYSGTGTTVDDVADADSVSQPQFCQDAGANDTYTCSLTPSPTGYTTGTHYRFKANTANTGAATINFNSLGAITIKKVAGGITTDVATDDIRAGQWIDLVYDGTNMQMQSTLGNAASGSGSATSGSTTWAFSGDISPTALSADQNNYNPTDLATSNVLRLRADTNSRNITGLVGGADGRTIFITNIGTPGTHFDVVLKHESGSSTDTNRFYNAGNLQGDVRIRPRQGMMLWYDTSEGTGRWKVMGGPINGDNLYAWIGSTAFPSYSFATKEGYGFYQDGNNAIPVVVNGADKYAFNTSSFLVKSGQSMGFATGGLGATGCTGCFRQPASGQIAVVDQDSDTIAATLYHPTRTASSTINLAQGNTQRITLASNTTFAAPSGRVDGIEFTLVVIQDGTGGWTCSFNAVFKFAGGAAPTCTAAANSVDIFRFWTNGTNVYEISRSMDVK